MSTMWRTIAMAMVVGLALFGLACERTPEKYDYHGGEVEIPEIDGWTTTDRKPPPDSEVTGEVPVPDADDAEGKPADGRATDGQTDGQVEELPDEPVQPGQTRSCTVHFEFSPPDGTAVFLASEATDWQKGQVPLADNGGGKWELDFDASGLAPGTYAYKFHTAADNWYLDPGNPMSKWVDAVENSKFIVPDCKLPQLILQEWTVDAAAGTAAVDVEVRDGIGSQGIVPSTAKVVLNGKKLDQTGFDPATGRFNLKLTKLLKGSKATLRFSIGNDAGQSEELYVPLWISNEDWTFSDAAMYFAFADRFFNGSKDNDGPETCTPKESLTNWQGGDFEGIRQKIEAGYFDELGISVIWVSPVINNPGGCFPGQVEGQAYTAYHGYFPLDVAATEEHFGKLEELQDLVNAAHDHGIRVLIDFVANHVHEQCSVYAQHQGDGWFFPFYPCEPNWDKPIECWFQGFLPDLDYTNDAVVEWMTENALYWIFETGADGFRVDAVKHMVHNFTRTLRWKIAQKAEATGIPFYMVGETFMGEWGGGTGLAETTIKEYVNPWELNGQFDFPFYWEILQSVARDEGDFQELGQFLTQSDGYYGKDAQMVGFIGNHDVPRFTSHADGKIADQWGNGSKQQGFSAPPAQPAAAEPYQRTMLALGLLFTLPEIPLVYYGDEVGLAGAGDPDNRRVMLFDGLSDPQKEVLAWVKKVGTLRKELVALRRGTLKVVTAEPDLLVFERTAMGQTVWVAANRGQQAKSAAVTVSGAGVEELLTGKTLTAAGGKVTVDLPPFGMAVLAAQ